MRPCFADRIRYICSAGVIIKDSYRRYAFARGSLLLFDRRRGSTMLHLGGVGRFKQPPASTQCLDATAGERRNRRTKLLFQAN